MKKSVWLILQNNKGNYVIGKRSKKVRNSNTWNFFGGTVDKESNKKALKREIKEETGLSLIRIKKIRTIKGKNKTNVYFTALCIKKRVTLNKENTKVKTIPFTKLKALKKKHKSIKRYIC